MGEKDTEMKMPYARRVRNPLPWDTRQCDQPCPCADSVTNPAHVLSWQEAICKPPLSQLIVVHLLPSKYLACTEVVQEGSARMEPVYGAHSLAGKTISCKLKAGSKDRIQKVSPQPKKKKDRVQETTEISGTES